MPRPNLRLTGVFLLVIVVGLGAAWLLRGGDVTVAGEGQAAPDFSVEVIEGGTFTLSEARGRPVVINFWASWCPPCRAEIPDISVFAESHPEVEVIGVAVEDIDDDSRAFAATIGASYPLALGNPQVEDAYPRIGLPVTYVIDPDGVVTEIVNGIVDEEILAELVG